MKSGFFYSLNNTFLTLGKSLSLLFFYIFNIIIKDPSPSLLTIFSLITLIPGK
ncbi:hypothetical protein SAMN04488009_1124 [Maribacter sedimenticola]|uniref:Uncharacterized protein n=1 Tax=Maribacter sedimenticola TaxID=228956 RepID=A0ABY1SE98_9FLAO|nr:hypothetical protein SAMN04488009_1124 [Maribacter sedimenticola]